MWDLSEIGNYIKVKYHLCFSVITFKNSSIVMNDGKSLPSFYQIKTTCESIQMLDRVARGYGRLLWETVGEKKKNCNYCFSAIYQDKVPKNDNFLPAHW